MHLAHLVGRLLSTLDFARSQGVLAKSRPLDSSFLRVCPRLSSLVQPLRRGTGYEHPRSPLERLEEHVAGTKRWVSRHSQHRFVHRTPILYRAMAAIGLHNVVMLPLASFPDGANLRRAEAFCIR